MNTTLKIIAFIFLCYSGIEAQNTLTEEKSSQELSKGIHLFQQDLFDQSIVYFDRILNTPANFSESQIFWASYYKGRANLYSSKSRVDDLKIFIQKYQPNSTFGCYRSQNRMLWQYLTKYT